MILRGKDIPDHHYYHLIRMVYAEFQIVERGKILTASLAAVRSSLRGITAWIIAIQATVPLNLPQYVLDFWEEMNKFSTFVKSTILTPILVVNKLLMERFAILDLTNNDLWTQEIVPLLVDLRTSLDDVYQRIPVLTTQLEYYSWPAQRRNLCHVRRLARESCIYLPHAIVTLDLLLAEQDMTNCLNCTSASESFA
jgi:hypothetical protein